MMLWEKKTIKQIREHSNERGYLYLRISEYKRDGRTLMRKARHLGDGSSHKKRNNYIIKRDIYLGKIKEITPYSFLSFQDYVISQLNKEDDYLLYILHFSFDEIFFDFISYLQEIYDISIQILHSDIVTPESQITKERVKKLKNITFSLQTDGFFNIVLLQRVYEFKPKKVHEISNKDFENFSNRCTDAGIFDEYIQMVLYLKLIKSNSLESIEDELYQLDIEKIHQFRSEQITFEDFMRRNN